MINITEKASSKMAEIMADEDNRNAYVRIYISGTG